MDIDLKSNNARYMILIGFVYYKTVLINR